MSTKQLAPEGAAVTESEMVKDPHTGQLREVDVTVRHEVAGYPVLICIECRDRGRKADVQWIDELAGKYGGRGAKALGASALLASIIAGALYAISPAAPFYLGAVLAVTAAGLLLLVPATHGSQPQSESA